MSKNKKTTLEVQGTAITVLAQNEDDFICITDIARFKNPDRTDDLVRNWLRNRNTLEFLGIWEQLNNLHFNPVEFDGIKMQAGLNSGSIRRGLSALSPKPDAMAEPMPIKILPSNLPLGCLSSSNFTLLRIPAPQGRRKSPSLP